MQVYFYEAFEEEAVALKNALPLDIEAGFTAKTLQESGHASPPAPLISMRTQSRIPESWTQSVHGILSRSTGYDHVHTYLSGTGVEISCGYLPLYAHYAVAEQALMLWMALLRKLPRQIAQFNRFGRDGLSGAECRGKTLLVVGVGHIGYEVVHIGKGLGMHILGVDIVHRYKDIEYMSIEAGIAMADVIVCAMNLTEDNQGYFDDKLLKRSKRGAVFVNVARGELSPSTVLLRMLEAGHLGSVGLDVFDHEAELAVSLREGNHPNDKEAEAALALAGMPTVILTPHNAFNTMEAVQRKVDNSVEQIIHFLKHGRFRWPVPSLNAAVRPL